MCIVSVDVVQQVSKVEYLLAVEVLVKVTELDVVVKGELDCASNASSLVVTPIPKCHETVLDDFHANPCLELKVHRPQLCNDVQCNLVTDVLAFLLGQLSNVEVRERLWKTSDVEGDGCKGLTSGWSSVVDVYGVFEKELWIGFLADSHALAYPVIDE